MLGLPNVDCIAQLNVTDIGQKLVQNMLTL